MQQVALYPKLPTQVKGSVSPQDGMGAFMQTLQSYLQNHGVHFYEKKVTLLKALEENYSSVVLATSASDAARILSAEYPEWSQRLSQIQMLSLTSVTQFKEKQHNQLQGFGVLFSRHAKTNALGVLFNDCIFKDRTKDCRSETWILPETESSDETVIKKISLDSQRLTPNVQTAVLATHITRWREALPQYSPALEELLKTLPIQNNRLHLHGNYLGSLGLSQILIRSKVLAERILAEQATL
jgi:protoporphyrinogen oxidase